jgi:deoxycytidylate deaminase
MRFITDKNEEELAIGFMNKAAEEARLALCLKAKCGTVIVKNDEIIGMGYNAPARDDIAKRICLEEHPLDKKFNKHDQTCCVHAEWRAIMDAFKTNSEKIKGSQLYFTRVDDMGNIKKSGKPYCTVCSRLALDSGISEFILWHNEGICVYKTDEYNILSYKNVRNIN